MQEENRLVRALIRLVLAEDLHKRPLSRTHITQKVMGDYTGQRITQQVRHVFVCMYVCLFVCFVFFGAQN